MESLFAIRPRHRRHIVLMVIGSLLVHAGLVGVAAIWPATKTWDVKQPDLELDLAPQLGDPEVRELVVKDEPSPPPDMPTPPPDEPTPPPDETPPPPDEPDMTEPEKPTPPPPKPKTNKPVTTPVPKNAKRGPVAQEGVMGGNPTGTKATGTPGGTKVGNYRTPKPSYPYQARASHVQGVTRVRVAFGGSGSVSSVVIVKSAGSGILDSNTTGYIKSNWTGPPNATLEKEFEYRLSN